MFGTSDNALKLSMVQQELGAVEQHPKESSNPPGIWPGTRYLPSGGTPSFRGGAREAWRETTSPSVPVVQKRASATAARVLLSDRVVALAVNVPFIIDRACRIDVCIFRRSVRDRRTRWINRDALVTAGGQSQAVEQLLGRHASGHVARKAEPVLLRSVRLSAAALIGGAGVIARIMNWTSNPEATQLTGPTRRARGMRRTMRPQIVQGIDNPPPEKVCPQTVHGGRAKYRFCGVDYPMGQRHAWRLGGARPLWFDEPSRKRAVTVRCARDL